MQDVMVEDESSNTSCTGRVIHTPTTPGLITRTYTPPKHCQTFTFLTPLRLDDQQYKETFETPKRILIPSPLWLSNTSKYPRQFTAHCASTTQTHSTLFTTFLIAQQCPTSPPPFSFHLARLLPLTVLATLPTSSPLLLLKAQLIRRWPYLMSK